MTEPELICDAVLFLSSEQSLNALRCEELDFSVSNSIVDQFSQGYGLSMLKSLWYRPEIRASVRSWAIQKIRDGQPIPEPMRDYVVSLLDPAGGTGGRRGRDPLANRPRDMQIAAAVWKLQQDGINPLRNEASADKMCGCAIVSAALHIIAEREGIQSLKMGEGGVAKVWQRMRYAR